LLTLVVTEVAATSVELLAVGGVWEETGLQALEGARLVGVVTGLRRRWLRRAGRFAAAHVGVYVRAADVGEGRQISLPQVGAH
jgi:hypothetical protein